MTILKVTIPEVTIPEVTVPEVTIPEVTVPEVTGHRAAKHRRPHVLPNWLSQGISLLFTIYFCIITIPSLSYHTTFHELPHEP